MSRKTNQEVLAELSPVIDINSKEFFSLKIYIENHIGELSRIIVHGDLSVEVPYGFRTNRGRSTVRVFSNDITVMNYSKTYYFEYDGSVFCAQVDGDFNVFGSSICVMLVTEHPVATPEHIEYLKEQMRQHIEN